MITRIKKSLTHVPASIAEAASYLRLIGEKQRAINKAKRDTKKRVEELQLALKQEVEALTKERDNFFVALFAFASPRKTELTRETRSQKTAAGTFGWRWNTPYVELKEGKNDQAIIATLKSKGLFKYIRVTEELDREALLVDRPVVPGVAYMQRDEFFAKPKLSKDEGRAEELVKEGTEAIDV